MISCSEFQRSSDWRSLNLSNNLQKVSQNDELIGSWYGTAFNPKFRTRDINITSPPDFSHYSGKQVIFLIRKKDDQNECYSKLAHRILRSRYLLSRRLYESKLSRQLELFNQAATR